MRGVVLILLAAVALCPACATVAPGNDATLVNAERSVAIAFETVDAFLFAEYTHATEIAAVEPRAHAVAEELRAKAPDVLATVTAAMDAYRANRTAEAKASMLTYLAVLESLAHQAQEVLVKWKGATP